MILELGVQVGLGVLFSFVGIWVEPGATWTILGVQEELAMQWVAR